MPKTKISEYSVTNSSNTDIEGINIDEGCAPSGINNAIRELMVHLKEFQTGASGDAFTFAGGVLISGTANTITGNVLMSGTNTITGSTTATFAAGAVGTPSIAAHGDTNTGIFFPAADTIAFTEGGAESMRINSSGQLLIGTTTNPQGAGFTFSTGSGASSQTYAGIFNNAASPTSSASARFDVGVYSNSGSNYVATNTTTGRIYIMGQGNDDGYLAGGFESLVTTGGNLGRTSHAADLLFFTKTSGQASGTEKMRIDSSGNVGIGTSSPASKLHISGGTVNTARIDGSNNGGAWLVMRNGAVSGGIYNTGAILGTTTSGVGIFAETGYDVRFYTNGSATERARITSGGVLLVGKTATGTATAGAEIWNNGQGVFTVSGDEVGIFNRSTNDGTIISLRQDNTTEGTISVSGNTVSYNAFTGGHWTQLQEGRGYNPEILRGTVMSSIGEMSEWKSVTWTETIEHPAIPAVEAKEAVVDEEGNVVEPAVEAVEGKDAWTESIPHREAYLGNLSVGATFEEDGFTKTVVDDGNERLPKVKISDVVGDKAVYGVFQTYDEVQDMLITSLGAFVVRIASGVTVQIGDLLESNGDGCAKVQDDDVIRSKTIGKVTSTTPSATYADGSYTVPAVLYCG